MKENRLRKAKLLAAKIDVVHFMWPCAEDKQDLTKNKNVRAVL